MKQIIFICMLSICCGMDTLFAQQSKEEKATIQAQIKKYQERYDQGERGRAFMKEYTFFVKDKGTISQLEKIADEYLKTIPVKKRYEGENLDIFLKGVTQLDAVSCQDLLKNWDEIAPGDEEKLCLKIERLYKNALFDNRVKKQPLTEDFITSMRQTLEITQSPNKTYYNTLLDMSIAADRKDVSTIMNLFQNNIKAEDLLGFENIIDQVVISSAINVVLEKADQQICENMLNLLKPFVKSSKDKNVFKSMYENFEGKLMTLAPDSPVLSQDKKEIKEIKYEEVSGFMFNTSWGGVMTEKEYKFLEDVFSSSNDSLKNVHLHTLLQIFRYNGYTFGLEKLKPLIEKNVLDCQEKQEVLSRYKTYAHLAPGKPAPEFKLKDANGNEYTLSDYRGKVVVIDVWATWCGGCIEKLPYFLKIQEKYKDRKDIEFLTISIDQKSAYNRWKFALPRYNLTKITSLIAPPDDEVCTFSEDYNITGIPRYFIIDKEGKIVNVYCPSPTNRKFEEMILQTLSL